MTPFKFLALIASGISLAVVASSAFMVMVLSSGMAIAEDVPPLVPCVESWRCEFLDGDYVPGDDGRPALRHKVLYCHDLFSLCRLPHKEVPLREGGVGRMCEVRFSMKFLHLDPLEGHLIQLAGRTLHTHTIDSVQLLDKDGTDHGFTSPSDYSGEMVFGLNHDSPEGDYTVVVRCLRRAKGTHN